MELTQFNALPPAEAIEVVSVWARVPAWAEAVVAARPFGSVEDLEAAADRLARAWRRPELDAALAHHPRIGERPRGEGAEANASRREQSAMTDAAASVAEQIAAGNASYEERFGRVFLIRAAGRAPEEILAELQRRLNNTADAEVDEALDQLRQIAMLRLRGDIDSDTSTGEPA
ncbi:2-oxo-4-hydroxy-4-carboxy-5-ureidoimidazoline decarboxylase [Microbacterium schleiferi]|uniref:2-oxo-4-hydroxy-4-carboxy-5-ureidoimidazoline decarboxylase n=1 Tax=Microbacterium schleiferi TaxID=69362 RepID=A0A7S8MWN9_9MICO|nr:2-oxo-4-hydroxy-4-carboxy-5-ureidoimidazoline decarboxylase [Microbacterium schleiferi]QPE04679.1 2-oxo-4-hydroxy-4-carboxy-5-ureidoimidazoline decarboxylase [Microbacterium schleiferi]